MNSHLRIVSHRKDMFPKFHTEDLWQLVVYFRQSDKEEVAVDSIRRGRRIVNHEEIRTNFVRELSEEELGRRNLDRKRQIVYIGNVLSCREDFFLDVDNGILKFGRQCGGLQRRDLVFDLYTVVSRMSKAG